MIGSQLGEAESSEDEAEVRGDRINDNFNEVIDQIGKGKMARVSGSTQDSFKS